MSSSVITNCSGPTTFVRYNRVCVVNRTENFVCYNQVSLYFISHWDSVFVNFDVRSVLTGTIRDGYQGQFVNDEIMYF